MFTWSILFLNETLFVKGNFSQGGENLNLVRRSPLPSRLIARLYDTPALIFYTNDVVFNLIAAIVQPPTDYGSFLRYASLVVFALLGFHFLRVHCVQIVFAFRLYSAEVHARIF